MKLRTLTPGLVGRVTAEHLASLAASVPADLAIVEIGVFMARTTTFLAAGARSGHGAQVFGVDPWEDAVYPTEWVNHEGRGRIRRQFAQPATRLKAERLVASVCPEVKLIHGLSVDVAERWAGPQVGLLFVDGNHAHDAVKADWDAWFPHLADGAVVAWDDYEPAFPGVTSVVDGLVASGTLTRVGVVAGRLMVTRRDT